LIYINVVALVDPTIDARRNARRRKLRVLHRNRVVILVIAEA